MHRFDAVDEAMRERVRSGQLGEIVREHYFEKFKISLDSGIIQAGSGV